MLQEESSCNFSESFVYTAGYAMGGQSSNVISKITFASEATAALAATLFDGTYGAAAPCWSATKGYKCGGCTAANNSSDAVDALTFADDTCARLVATLPTAIGQNGGNSTSAVGLCFGGRLTGAAPSDVIQKLTFASEATSTSGETLIAAEDYHAVTGTTDYSYLAGGLRAPTNGVYKFANATESMGAAYETLSAATWGHTGVSEDNYGYFFNGFSGAYSKKIEQVSYATDAVTLLADITSSTRSGSAGIRSTSMAYTACGYNSALMSSTGKYEFSTGTSSLLGTALTPARNNPCGVQTGSMM